MYWRIRLRQKEKGKWWWRRCAHPPLPEIIMENPALSRVHCHSDSRHGARPVRATVAGLPDHHDRRSHATIQVRMKWCGPLHRFCTGLRAEQTGRLWDWVEGGCVTGVGWWHWFVRGVLVVVPCAVVWWFVSCDDGAAQCSTSAATQDGST